MSDLESLAGNLPPAPRRLAKLPPLDLPSVTFIHSSSLMNSFMFAQELGKQSEFVYEIDLLQPIYDAVQGLYGLPLAESSPYLIATKHEIEVAAIRGATNLDLFARLMLTIEDILAFHPYQFVVRDSFTFTIPPHPLLKNCLHVNLDLNTLSRGVPITATLTIPPQADLVKEIRQFLTMI